MIIVFSAGIALLVVFSVVFGVTIKSINQDKEKLIALVVYAFLAFWHIRLTWNIATSGPSQPTPPKWYTRPWGMFWISFAGSLLATLLVYILLPR